MRSPPPLLVSTLLAALGATLAGACGDGPKPAPAASGPSAGAKPPIVGAAAAPLRSVVDDPDRQAPCEDLGTLSGPSLVSKVANASQWLWLPIASRPTPTRVGVIAVGSPADLVGRTVPLGTGLNASYATCTHCFAVAVGCAGNDCLSAAWFFAQSGTATFTALASGPDQPFVGELDGVTLAQVTIDPSTYESKVVRGGACILVRKFTFASTTTALAPDRDAGGGSDAASADDADSDGGSSSSGGGGGGAKTGSVNGKTGIL